MTIQAGQVLLDRWEIREELGRGGHSIVYAARDRKLDAEVAVKLLVPPPADSDRALERLRREVRAVRGVGHPNIVPIHDLIEEGQRAYVVMERIDGPDLAARVRAQGVLSSEEASRVGREVAGALHAAHRAGIVHRDVKPHNILVGADGSARLTDFGSARGEGDSTLTHTGGFVGTLDYAAPERFAGERGDGRADVYSLGMTLFHALTGRLPERTSPHLPPTPSANGHSPRAFDETIDPWLDSVVQRATAADPEDRHATAQSLERALSPLRLESAGASPPAPVRAFCLACGEGVGSALTCARCNSSRKPPTDTFVFVRPEHPREAAARLVALTRRRARDVAAVSRGERPLVATHAQGAGAVVERLEEMGVRAHTVSKQQLHRQFPASLIALLAAMYAVGAILMFNGHFALGVAGPILATLGTGLATLGMMRPLVRTTPRLSQFEASVEAILAEASPMITTKTASRLWQRVTDLAAEQLHDAGADDRERVQRLVKESTAVAIALSRSEELLVRAEATERDTGLERAAARAGHNRDLLVQRLLESVALLIEMRTDEASEATQRAARLDELNNEIAEELDARRAAVREVEDLFR